MAIVSQFKPVIASSPFFKEIMEDFEKYGNDLTQADFWRNYIVARDPNIPLSTWSGYVRRLRKRKIKENPQDEVQNNTPTIKQNSNITMKKLQENSIEYMMQVGVGALQDLADNEEKAKKLPIKDRLGMLKDAIKLKNDNETLALKRDKDNNEKTLFEEIMDDVQYGEVKEEEILENVEVEIEKKPKKNIPKKEKIMPHVEVLSSFIFKNDNAN